MQMTQIGSATLQLTRWGSVNSFFVQADDGLTVIDTNVSGSAPRIVQAAERLGQPIRRIAITHAHSDHVGSLEALQAAVPDAKLWLSSRSAQFLAGQMALQPDEPQAGLRGSFVTMDLQTAGTFDDGDTLGDLQVIATPGHTPDHVAFLNSRDGTLIAGDAFQTKGGTAVAGTVRWLFPFPAFATWHRPTAVRSAKKLLGLRPDCLAVGHGAPISQPERAMRQAIEAAEQ